MFHIYIQNYIDMLGYWKVYDGHQIGMHWAYQYCGKQTMASCYCGKQHAKTKHQNDSEIVLYNHPQGRLIFHWIYYSRFSNENHYKWFIWEYLRLRLHRISIRFITGESTIGGKNIRYPIWIFAPNMVCVNHIAAEVGDVLTTGMRIEGSPTVIFLTSCIFVILMSRFFLVKSQFLL